MGLELRVAEPDDVPALTETYIASWRAGYAGLLRDEVVDHQSTLRRNYDWLRAIQSSSSVVIVAVDQSIVGVVQATENLGGDRDLPEITMLYVAPSAWGEPVAKALLAEGSSWMHTRGHRAARLRVVDKQVRARRFYEREGWTVDTDLAPASNGFFQLIYYRHDLGRSS